MNKAECTNQWDEAIKLQGAPGLSTLVTAMKVNGLCKIEMMMI